MRILCIVFVILHVSQAVKEQQEAKIWNLFKRVHQKNYVNRQEEEHRSVRERFDRLTMIVVGRFGVFRENIALINRHNLEADSGLHSYTLKINQFADLVCRWPRLDVSLSFFV